MACKSLDGIKILAKNQTASCSTEENKEFRGLSTLFSGTTSNPRHGQMRLSSDLKRPLAMSNASTAALTLRVEIQSVPAGLEGLVDPAARLEPAGEEAALLQFGNSQGEIRLLGDEYAPARMKPSTDGYRDLGLQQMLEAPANDPRNQGARRRAEPARRTNYGQGSWPAVGLVAVLRTGPQTS